MNARLVDWSLAAAVGVAFASGLLSLVSGRPEDWWVFTLHGVAGLWLLPLTAYKLIRVWPRLVRPAAWDRRTILGIAAVAITALTLITGVLWTTGGTLVVAGYNLLNWHIIFGLLLTTAVSAHMIARARPLARRRTGEAARAYVNRLLNPFQLLRPLTNRRQALRWSALVLAAVALWPAKNAAARALDTPGGRRRFTGSREVGSFGGNGAFPYVIWAADRPRPLDVAAWRLRVGGAVAAPYALSYADLLASPVPPLEEGPGVVGLPVVELEATLDCTGGFFTRQRWGGVLIGDLLERAGPLPSAQYVRFVSVTGYRWSLPLEEARAALVATHIGGAPLDHGHGFPARMVAPGRRGFEWVKWLVAVELLEEPDPSQLLVIWTSGLTSEGSRQS
ncbi:MAG: hypothetical protein RLZZ387_4949 [Chloroflexota bacterium]|jgi:DMSO/TMAO reductase YedYZ molybdopterin-dependent catalytic subunit